MRTWDPRLPGVVRLPDGRLVRGRSLSAGEPAASDRPDFAVYAAGRALAPVAWEHAWIRWPDFRLPADPDAAVAVLRDAYGRAATSRVEVACAGGTGRTGTMLALLARIGGVPADDAVAWTRAAYRAHAVETPWQRRFVRRIDLA